MGFKEVEEAFRKYCVKDKKSDEPDNKAKLPEGYKEGRTLASVKAEKSTHYTAPPKMFTEDTLLAAMETAEIREFDSETEKRDLGHRQPELILLRNWYLPGMQNVKENRFFLRRQAVS